MQEMVQESSSAMRANPSPGAVRAAVRSLLPTIRSRAVACERARSVPDETVEELRQTGLYKLVQPAAYGGYEQDFVVLADLMMDMAGACASTAWVCGLLSAHQWLVGLFPAEAQHDVWGSNPGATLCGSYAPISEAAAADRRLSPERPLVLRQRLRQCPVGDLRGAVAGDGAASEPAGVPAGPGERLRDRRHLGRHRPCRHGKQDPRSQRCVRARAQGRVVCGCGRRAGPRAAGFIRTASMRFRSTAMSPPASPRPRWGPRPARSRISSPPPVAA